ncbi:MAG: TVP38/TMEM64 family protein [Gammaproteobacteria bacterium]|nr:VTT domain-containing protein [Gammaproteobacteria bacterium]NNC98186.1 TVP38/TMEM64 family protein [Gammaproteobacteria bacterium]NNM14866.1 TVP38/TMEM64 family protein [Gammaproteobacteria bacterium]
MPGSTQFQRKLLASVILVTLILLFLSSDELFSRLENLLVVSESWITKNPVFGMFLFVLLSALSAMLAFFSSAILVPIGVHTWGWGVCFILLWAGWWLGGLFAYCVGYFAGNRVVDFIVGEARLEKFKSRITGKARFWHIVLFQASVPSEVPGYVLGTLRFRIDYYLAALALTELPYALGTVLLGESFLQRNLSTTVGIIAAALLVAVIGYHIFKQKFTHDQSLSQPGNSQTDNSQSSGVQ